MPVADTQFTIRTPAAVSTVAFGIQDQLFIGSDDGSIRVYNLPSTRVVKAINNLGSEISSIAWVPHSNSESGELWVACGTKALAFSFSDSKMILSTPDAISVLVLGEDPEDILNEIGISHNNKNLAFSTDGGTVGIVDLATRQVTRMKTRHSSICGSVKFIPERPNEIISGGYDSALLHFDIMQRTTLSRYDFEVPPLSDGTSLAPPFVHSISLATAGTVAASTADGRIWIGHGGEKQVAAAGAKVKRSRKWEGLRAESGVLIKAAEGPVVSVAFQNPSSLIACTLLGNIARYTFNNGIWDSVWTRGLQQLAKVNAMQVQGEVVAVGGFDAAGKGVVEVLQSNID